MHVVHKHLRRRTYKLLLFSWVAILVAGLALPGTAQAWKPTTHVYLADLALQDALDNGKVTIYRVDYASGQVTDTIGEYTVDPAILSALRSNPAQYRAGVLGPDAYPDILTGQQVIHPSPKDTGIQGGSNAWLQYLWDQSLRPENNTPAVRAFVTGYLTHAAGDMFGHTFINNFTGAPFAMLPPEGPENAIKHVIVEGYVDKRLPKATFTDAFFNNVSIAGVDDFIYRTMIDARPGTQLDRQLLRAGAGGTDYSVPRVFSTLRASLQRDIDGYYATKADYQRRIDSCAWFDFSCSKVALGTELAAYVVANGPATTYEEYWRDDIDNGLRAWPSVSHAVAKALFFNAGRKADTQAAEDILQRYATDHLLSMAGSPDFVGLAAGTIADIIRAITPDFLLVPIRELKKQLLDTMLKESIGMTKEELKDYLSSPDKYFDQVMTTGAGERVTLQQFNNRYLHIGDPRYTNPGEAFDYHQVPAAYNTVTMSKLLMLGPGEVNRLLRDLGGQPTLTTPDIMLGFIQTLDGDNQWTNGMALAQNCQVYGQVFMRQPGERGFADCPPPAASSALDKFEHTGQYYSNDAFISDTPNVPLAECAQRCLDNGTCTAFTHSYGAQCTLFAGKVTPLPANNDYQFYQRK